MLNTMQEELNLYLLQFSRNYGPKTARNPDFGQNPTKWSKFEPKNKSIVRLSIIYGRITYTEYDNVKRSHIKSLVFVIMIIKDGPSTKKREN